MQKVIAVLLITIFLGSCKLDEAGFPKPTIFTGKWYKTSSTLKSSTTDSNGVTPTNSETAYFDHTDYISFKENGTGDQSKGGVYSTFTYVKNGNSLIINYAATGDQPASTTNATVVQLQQNTFQFQVKYTTTTDGVITYYTYDIYYAR